MSSSVKKSAKRPGSQAEVILEKLEDLKISRGLLRQLAKDGQLTKVGCEMPNCYCPKGRDYFDEKTHPPTEWALTADHYPRLKRMGGV